MKRFKGTKGKWKITNNDLSESGGFIRIGTKKHTWIVETKGCHVGTTNKEALYNAKLVACAPEMLEMIIRFSKINQIARGHINEDLFVDLEILIDKAIE